MDEAKVNAPVIANQPGADPGAVVFDAVKAAKTRGYDVLLVDTAGRVDRFNKRYARGAVKAEAEAGS